MCKYLYIAYIDLSTRMNDKLTYWPLKDKSDNCDKAYFK